MSAPAATTQQGFPLVGLLGVALVVMKLAGIGAVASWSWWLVLLPFYVGIPIPILILIVIVALIVLAAAGDFDRPSILRSRTK